MCAAAILRQLGMDLNEVHRSRLRALFDAVTTLLSSGRLSLTSLGRALARRGSQKHGIKRADRLIGNPRLHAERLIYYRVLAQRIVGAAPRPIILVDWTAVTPKMWALVAAVSFEGRALVVYAEAHPITRYLKPKVNADFLRRLKSVLPADCKPIIVTDAGFRTPWMRLVLKHGWDYVGRVRGLIRVRLGEPAMWSPLSALYRLIRTVPTELGVLELGRAAKFKCRVVAIRKRRLYHRPQYRRPPHGGAAREKESALEPWTLATSLTEPAATVINIYRQRMQIEETFRDTKNSRFGLSMSHARTKKVERAQTLLLLAALTHVIAVLVGIAAERAQLHYRYQANTVRRRRVLSFATLGRLVIASHDARISVLPTDWPNFASLPELRSTA